MRALLAITVVLLLTHNVLAASEDRVAIALPNTTAAILGDYYSYLTKKTVIFLDPSIKSIKFSIEANSLTKEEAIELIESVWASKNLSLEKTKQNTVIVKRVQAQKQAEQDAAANP